MAFEEKWKGFEQKVKAKRDVNKRKIKNEKPHTVNKLTVQRLSSDVSRRAQKFSHIGRLEFVPYPHGDLTMDLIKKACNEHFYSQLKKKVQCDVLVGEQGTSCQTLDQIPNVKLIHVRFVGMGTGMYSAKSLSSDSSEEDSASIPSIQPKALKRRYEMSDHALSVGQAKIQDSRPRVDPPVVANIFPKSLSVTQMLDLGRVVQKKSVVAEILKFTLENMAWCSVPEKVELIIDEKPFAQGGFRNVYKAKLQKCIHTVFWFDIKWRPSLEEQLEKNSRIFLELRRRFTDIFDVSSGGPLRSARAVIDENGTATFQVLHKVHCSIELLGENNMVNDEAIKNLLDLFQP
eukprot:gene2205-2510_t